MVRTGAQILGLLRIYCLSEVSTECSVLLSRQAVGSLTTIGLRPLRHPFSAAAAAAAATAHCAWSEGSTGLVRRLLG
jgi:hypothetical protein